MNTFYSGLVWILSAVALAAYGVLLFTHTNIPGMEELVTFLTTIDSTYIYITAFISVFIEGLYFFGSFFPGASLVIVLAIISQANGLLTLGITTFLIFIGWCLAGVVNIYGAKLYRTKIIKLEHLDEYHIRDRIWTTWFPAFRASYEVAQVVEGGKPVKVFRSSLRVRFWASLAVGVLALIIPLFFDVKKTTNEEGFAVIIVIICINVWVGVRKIREYYTMRLR